MLNSKIVYATKTNHSKKIAEAIASELNLKAENIVDQPVINDVDLLFIVGGIYGGESMPTLADYVGGLTSSMVKKVALITSCLSAQQSQGTVRKILEEKGIQVIDEFICRGGLLFIYFTHPNSTEIKNAIAFAKNHTVSSF